MLVTDLLKQINGDWTPPPVLLFCPGRAGFDKEPFEPLLAEQAVQAIVEKLVDPSLADLTYSVFYADETQPGAITDEAQTLPFLAERRLILVRNGERYDQMSGGKGSMLAPLVQYLKSPSESTVLMIIAGKADKRKALYKACKDLEGIVECPQLSDGELAQWVQVEGRKMGRRFNQDAIRELLGRAGARLGDVRNALTLVTNYVGEAREIRAEDVVAACADVAEESVWNLTDAISASDTDKALRVLYELLDYGKSPDEIMGLINWLLETVYRACPETRAENKSRFMTEKVMPLVRKWGLKKVMAACTLCTDTHFMIRSTGVDKRLALELLVVKLSVGRKRAARA